MLRLLLLALVFFVPALARAQQDEARSLSHQGIERLYLLHLPAGGAGRGPRPLVIALHGRDLSEVDDVGFIAELWTAWSGPVSPIRPASIRPGFRGAP